MQRGTVVVQTGQIARRTRGNAHADVGGWGWRARVLTADEVREPRTRRVEIVVR